MKKTLLLIVICILVSTLLKAQSVAINTDGTTAHSSAILDIKSITKGMLAPRMTSVQRTAIATPAAGLLVYDTDTNSFWFYNGSAWSNLSASGTLGWLLTGNSSTNPATNFIGTTDNQPLRFKVNNVWAGEIQSTTGNIFLGINAGLANTSGQHNTALGIATLKNNTSGNENVAIGDSSLYSQNGSVINVAVGTHSLFANTTGNANTGVGPYALWNNVNGGFNTAVGVNSLYHNISGTENTAVGSRALQFNEGSYNTATGASALRLNYNATSNTANGYQALYSNLSGSYNVANGAFALYSNTTGENNIAIGYAALYNQSFSNGGVSWATNNTAVGVSALQDNQPTSTSNGIKNTAVGHSALLSNTTGFSNTAIGYAALNSNITGVENTASGQGALYANSNGVDNVADGYGALAANTGGSYNTASGVEALNSNTTGAYNTANGVSALRQNTTGSFNTAVGQFALYNLTGGFGNTAIGDNSGTDIGSPSVNNTISIGNDGFPNAASNQAFIGNMSTGWIGGHVIWSTYSDERIKKNIKEEVKGLGFIMRLRPVTYTKSLEQMRAITGNKDTKDFPGKYDVEKIKYSGFLAQDVEKAANESGYDFDGVHKPQNEHDLYSLSYAEFVVPLVKAMQEQQAMIKSEQQQIDLLMKRIEALEKK